MQGKFIGKNDLVANHVKEFVCTGLVVANECFYQLVSDADDDEDQDMYIKKMFNAVFKAVFYVVQTEKAAQSQQMNRTDAANIANLIKSAWEEMKSFSQKKLKQLYYQSMGQSVPSNGVMGCCEKEIQLIVKKVDYNGIFNKLQ